MIKGIIASLFFVISVQAHSRGLDLVINEDTSQTPFQKIEALFNQAGPIQLNQLPTPQLKDVRGWQCVNVEPETTRESIKLYNYMIAHAVGKIVTPAIPPAGPEFPGVPGHTQTVDVIVDAPIDGSFHLTAEYLGQTTIDLQTQLETSPDLQSTDIVDSGQKSKIDGNELMLTSIQTIRTINDYIVEKSVMKVIGVDTPDGSVTMYSYCWKTAPPPKRR